MMLWGRPGLSGSPLIRSFGSPMKIYSSTNPHKRLCIGGNLDWPSLESGYEGQPETRRGVDALTFRDGLIIEKLTYSKTTLEIDGQRVGLAAVSSA